MEKGKGKEVILKGNDVLNGSSLATWAKGEKLNFKRRQNDIVVITDSEEHLVDRYNKFCSRNVKMLVSGMAQPWSKMVDLLPSGVKKVCVRVGYKNISQCAILFQSVAKILKQYDIACNVDKNGLSVVFYLEKENPEIVIGADSSPLMICDYVLRKFQDMRFQVYAPLGFMNFMPRLLLSDIFLKIMPLMTTIALDECDIMFHRNVCFDSELNAVAFLSYYQSDFMRARNKVINYEISKALKKNWYYTLTQMGTNVEVERKKVTKVKLDKGHDVEYDIIYHKYGPTLVREINEVNKILLSSIQGNRTQRRHGLAMLMSRAVCEAVLFSSAYFGVNADSRSWRQDYFDNYTLMMKELSKKSLKLDFPVLITEHAGVISIALDIKRKSWNFWSFAATVFNVYHTLENEPKIGLISTEETVRDILVDLRMLIDMIQRFIDHSVWIGWTTHLQSIQKVYNATVFWRDVDGVEISGNPEAFRRALGYPDRIDKHGARLFTRDESMVVDRIRHWNFSCDDNVDMAYGYGRFSCRCSKVKRRYLYLANGPYEQSFLMENYNAGHVVLIHEKLIKEDLHEDLEAALSAFLECFPHATNEILYVAPSNEYVFEHVTRTVILRYELGRYDVEVLAVKLDRMMIIGSKAKYVPMRKSPLKDKSGNKD